jgi:hypothetical protein
MLVPIYQTTRCHIPEAHNLIYTAVNISYHISVNIIRFEATFIYTYTTLLISPPASAEVKKIWIYTFTSSYAFMAL